MEKSRSNQPSPYDGESDNTEFWRDTVIEQIMAIRDEGRTNMLDTNAVQRLAFEQDFYELVDFIESNRKAYAKFIFTGDREVDMGG